MVRLANEISGSHEAGNLRLSARLSGKVARNVSSWSWNDSTTIVKGKDMAGMAGSKAMVREMVCASCWTLTSLTRYASVGNSMVFSSTRQQVSSCVVFMKTSVRLLVVNTLESH